MVTLLFKAMTEMEVVRKHAVDVAKVVSADEADDVGDCDLATMTPLPTLVAFILGRIHHHIPKVYTMH